jgi:hypothetical protein
MTPLRSYYFKLIFWVYSVWVVTFNQMGTFASKLPTVNLSIWLDRQIPVVPEFVWIYMFCYLYPILPAILVKDWHYFNIALFSIIFSTLIAFLFHLSLPVAYPLPYLGNSLSDRFLRFWHQYDFRPGAMKFPSLHVAIAWIIFACLKHQNFGAAANFLFFLSSLLITASTVFTKQHIILDVIGGTGLAFVIWRFAMRKYFKIISFTDNPKASLRKASVRFLPIFLLCAAGVIFLINLKSPYRRSLI